MLIIPILLLRLGWLLLAHIKYWKNLRTGQPTTPNQIMSMSLRMFPGEFLLYTVGWAQTARQTLVYRHRPFLSRDQELKQLHLNDVKEMFKKRFPFKLLISFIRVWSIQLDLISIHTHPARFAFSELKFSVVLHWHFVFYVSFVQRWISRSIHCVAEFGFVLSLAWRLSSLSLSSLLSEEAVDSLKATFGELSFDKSENFSMRSATVSKISVSKRVTEAYAWKSWHVH